MRDITDVETFGGDELVVHELPARARHAAALTVCDRALDPGDARMLLDMCDLLEIS